MNVETAVYPKVNVVIQASAGTGKTTLIVNRVVRLLLDGYPPDSILCITFTKKAAAEIENRVADRLARFTASADSELAGMLTTLGINPDPARNEIARGLADKLLSIDRGFRSITFHAFCTEILRRFPLESGVPPGFSVLEHDKEYEEAAWRELIKDATQDVGGDLAVSLDEVFRACSGLHSARYAILDFLKHRSDWLAFVEECPSQSESADFAKEKLRETLGPDVDDDPLQWLAAHATLKGDLADYATLRGRIPSLTHQRAAESIRQISVEFDDQFSADSFQEIYSIFFTESGTIRILKDSKTLRRTLGEDSEALLLLHEKIAQTLHAIYIKRARHLTYKTSIAWFHCGTRLLHHYQRLKNEHGMLDFADLEWHTYRLLNQGRHAEWVQYKLDQRIDHLLVDEFQDTNPTQWRLLLPLLREMAAGTDRSRSVFVVGDQKQSIYRFRRADPKLLNTATNWLQKHMAGSIAYQHLSWRSSPAIVEFVNLVFDSKPPILPDFRRHETHMRDLWGAVEVLPLVGKRRPNTETARAFRNPLNAPRHTDEDMRYMAEGELIVEKIAEIIGSPIGPLNNRKPLDYGDIIILIRTRAPAVHYEQALRKASIPYIGPGHANLLDCLEVQDILHLLRALISPYDNHALAWALRSPIFDCTEDDLILLSSSEDDSSWRIKLFRLDSTAFSNPALPRAADLLKSWVTLADRIPVHDLLDNIYYRGDILARYASAAPEHIRARATANLTHLLDMALEVDSGRYPSLTRFITRLRAQSASAEAESPSATDVAGKVRILTIHAAKGLEAAAIFLADAARLTADKPGARALVQWPAHAPRPNNFHLIGNKSTHDDVSKKVLGEEQLESHREEMNMLYVALTRARQLLFISGCERSAHGNRGWYGLIEASLMRADGKYADLHVHAHSDSASGTKSTVGRLEYANPGPPVVKTHTTSADPIAVDPRFFMPINQKPFRPWIVPSQMGTENPTAASAKGGRDARRAAARGIAIHRMLELLTTTADTSTLRSTLRREYMAQLNDEEFEDCWSESRAVIGHPPFAPWFDSNRYVEARNELPVLYRRDDADVYGTIDRIVISEDGVTLLDYKTHSEVERESVEPYIESAAKQLRLYAEAARRIWPGRPLRAYAVFTAYREAIEIRI